MNSSVWRDVRSRNRGQSGSGDMIVGLRDGNRIWRVSPDRQDNPPPPTLPTEFDGERSRGQAFLNSVQTYMRLCPNSFHSNQVKITWTLSYMKSGRAAKWAAQVFRWEEENGGYSKFLDWDKFWMEFWKDFCPAHSDTAAINTLESTSYY